MDTPQVRTLDQELRLSLKQINNQMEHIRKVAVREDTPPVTMIDERGNFIWLPLVVAKAHILHAFALRGLEVRVDDYQP